MKKADYEKMKIEYATTDVSYRKLAEKYGVSRNTIQRVGTRNNWVEARKRHKEDVSREVCHKVSLIKAEKQASIYKEEKSLLRKLEKLLETSLLINDASHTDEPIAPRDLKALSETLKNIITMKDHLEGNVTVEQREAMNVARERLELERKRVDLESKRVEQGESDTEVVVVFPDEVEQEGWAD